MSSSLESSAATAASNIRNIILGVEDRVTDPKPDENQIIDVAAQLIAAVPILNSPFCATCRIFELYIDKMDGLSVVLGTNKLNGLPPDRVPLAWHARLGHRSEIKERAEVQKCPGCKSLLAAWDAYMNTGDETDFDPAQYRGHEDIDYDFRLVVERDREAWTLSMKIACSMAYKANLHLQPTVKYPPSFDLGRVCDPSHINLSVLRKWIACCQESHSDTCAAAIVSTNLGPTTPVNYIDLKRSCIVTLPSTPIYVALSYVWGRVPTLMTTKANFEDLSRPGSLIKAINQIPKTVRDAMYLTLSLGVDFLWVDALCIVQDDYEVKQDHLRAMPSIYSLAQFTIAVISGADANAGIQGIGNDPDPRSVPPSITLPTKTVAIKSSTHQKRLKFLNRMGFHSRPIWSRRAWTMQEQLYSKRILLLEGLASWICMRTQFREEVERAVEDTEYAKSNPENERYRLIQPRYISLKLYGKLVMEYNQRDLSFEEDVSDAFLGISALNVPIFGPIHFGMPEAFFDYAMCWQPSQKLRSRKPTNLDRKLPSWSWMGWHGELDLALWEIFPDHILEIFNDMKRIPFPGFDIRVRPSTTFYKSCLSCNQRVPISNSYHESRNVVTTPGWTRFDAPSHWTGIVDAYFHRDSEKHKNAYRYPIVHPEPSSPHLCRNPVIDTTLNFQTRRLFFTVSVAETSRKQNKWDTELIIDAHILDQTGVRIGSVSPFGLPLGSSYKNCEFIAISTGSCPSRQSSGEKWGKTWQSGRSHPFEIDVDGDFAMGEPYEFVNVLWVETRQGITYRKTLGRISKREWEKGAGQEVDVILG